MENVFYGVAAEHLLLMLKVPQPPHHARAQRLSVSIPKNGATALNGSSCLCCGRCMACIANCAATRAAAGNTSASVNAPFVSSSTTSPHSGLPFVISFFRTSITSSLTTVKKSLLLRTLKFHPHTVVFILLSPFIP
eukprot:3931847-Rhodomonas_salina.4